MWNVFHLVMASRPLVSLRASSGGKAIPSPHTGITNTARVYTLTDLTNYVWYIVTLNAMLDSTRFLTDTVTVMPTDRLVYLPLVAK